MKQVKLTQWQADQVRWALDCMVDFWCSAGGAEDRDGQQYDESQLPQLSGLTLELSPVDEINSDLHYRVAIQLPDMAEQMRGDMISNQRAGATYRNCALLAAKLEQQGVKPE